MYLLKEQRISGEGDVGDADGGQRRQLSGRQRTVLSPPPPPPPPPQLSSGEMILVGSFYEINHSMLVASGAKYYPDQLKLVRVVSVSEITGVRVSLRFPSIYSLRNHFNDSRSNRTREGTKKLPPLDEKYVVSSDVASQLLQRRVSSGELAERKDIWSFWALSSSSSPTISITTSSPLPSLATGIKGLLVKKGTCWSELKCGQLVQWGTRRKVQFLSRYHKETNNNLNWQLQSVGGGYRPKVSEFLAEGKEVEVDNHDDQREENEKEMAESVKDEETEEEEEEEEEDQEEVGEGSTEDDKEEGYQLEERKVQKQVKKTLRVQASNRCSTAETRRRSGRKRKACGTSTSRTLRIKKAKPESSTSRTLMIKKAKPDNAKKQVVSHVPKNRRRMTKTSIDRWSVERYKLAELNMLKILREKGAVYGNPVLRPALRQEARKLIGDTGLLDHLLKHMAGEVAPGGVERFRRRHNANGAMEYWLESADLVNIRKDAGVQDPYWTPPPGWRPGDSPSQDPICAKEFKYLRKEMAKLKGEMQELKSKKQEESLAIVAFKADQENNSLSLPLKEMYTELLKRKSVMEEQLREVSKCLNVMKLMQEGMKLTVEGAKGSELEEPITPAGNEVGERVRVGDNAVAVVVPVEEPEEDKGEENMKKTAKEDKAAKIERLKSGFRICRPQGTFLWPSMAVSSSLPPPQFAVEDLLVVPTPTPVPSSPPSHLHHHHHQASDGGVLAASPNSPVKPLAEKGTVSLAATSPEMSQGLTAATGATSLTPSMDHASSPDNGALIPITSVSAMEKPLSSSQLVQHEPIEDATQTTADATLAINLNELPNNTSALTYKRRYQKNPAAAAASAAISSWEGDDDINMEVKQQHLAGSGSSSDPSCSPSVPVGGVPSWLALASAPNDSSSDFSPSHS